MQEQYEKESKKVNTPPFDWASYKERQNREYMKNHPDLDIDDIKTLKDIMSHSHIIVKLTNEIPRYNVSGIRELVKVYTRVNVLYTKKKVSYSEIVDLLIRLEERLTVIFKKIGGLSLLR